MDLESEKAATKIKKSKSKNNSTVEGSSNTEDSTNTKDDDFTPRGRIPGEKRDVLEIKRYFTINNENPLDKIKYVTRKSVISDVNGQAVFEMNDVEVPESWSQLATDIIVSKYFRKAGVPETGGEKSAKQVVHRITRTIAEEGLAKGYFNDKNQAKIFQDELAYLLITQRAAFNSPVWFNCGLKHEYNISGSGGNFYYDEKLGKVIETEDAYSRPQVSACFIQSIQDDLMSIFELAKNEARLFKHGSGTGTNFSSIRGKQEKLSGGGTSSGLLSFLHVLDKGAGATKSGGTTRRAAKMATLDMDHPEIVDFIEWKSKEEKKAKILIDAGYPSDFNGEAYATVSGQNSNNSVRANDKFMNAVETGGEWQTIFRTTGEVADTYQASDLMDKISKSAWECADPGLQYDDTINKWHTCKNDGRINASNPCSEFMFLDDSACNLSSINLGLYSPAPRQFDTAAFRYTVRVLILAQEILVGLASYPTEKVAKNSWEYRPLGLGYANLGAMLMRWGIPYDSDEGRNVCSSITSLLTGEAYYSSSIIAKEMKPFSAFARNKKSMLEVMSMHQAETMEINPEGVPDNLYQEATSVWNNVLEYGEKYGFRNAQTTLLAPTGTIGLLMDCDTTGIEPDFSIVKWKKLAGGGFLKIINDSVEPALLALGYPKQQVNEIKRYVLGSGSPENIKGFSYLDLSRLGFSVEAIEEAYDVISENKIFDNTTVHITPESLAEKGMPEEDVKRIERMINGAYMLEGAPYLKEEHLPVFDCANPCGDGVRFLEASSHLRMMAAAQPFLSGAISKTVNIPENTTEKEIRDIYMTGWKMGLKSVALYRDGSKSSQPLNSKLTEKEKKKQLFIDPERLTPRGEKRFMPRRRGGFTIEAKVGGHKIYVRTGEYEDGRLGEIFIDMHKEGAAFRSLLNCFAMAISHGLQHGVPVEKFVDSFIFTRFEPQGMTDHPNIRNATSVIDFIFRIIGLEYCGRTDFIHIPLNEEQQKYIDAKQAQLDKIKNGTLDLSDTVAGVQKYMNQPELPGLTLDSASSVSSANSATNSMDDGMKDLMGDAPPCDMCGHITVRNGSCYRCTNCGNSMGCS